MKSLLLAAALVLSSTQALASHPHDRVCVGSAKLADGSTASLIFQWESERNYESGDPNKDSHDVGFEASTAYGDYGDLDATKLTGAKVTVAPGKSFAALPLVLKDAKGLVFFDGKFDATTETLTGSVDQSLGSDAKAKQKAVVKLSCVGQPRLTLDMAEIN